MPKTQVPRKLYWAGDLMDKDDFGMPYGKYMFDGRTRHGQWANMSEKAWRMYGVGKIGAGHAQKYERQEDGRWLKIEG